MYIEEIYKRNNNNMPIAYVSKTTNSQNEIFTFNSKNHINRQYFTIQFTANKLNEIVKMS